MSEYQYHEWQTIDRLLTEEEQSAVDDLSSHMEVSPSRAVVTYNWSDFRYDPKEVLLQYFDAYFYLANWGSRRLMFRFPKGLLNEAEIDRYCDEEYVTFQTSGNHQVLDINFNPEDGGDWEMEPNGTLSDFIHLREDLLAGDYRLLYLAWLKAQEFMQEYYYDDADAEEKNEDSEVESGLEPPVPPGLKKLSPALQNFARVFDLDPSLIQAAAEASPDLPDNRSINYRELVSHLSRSEADDSLVRLAEEDPGVKIALRKRLSEFLPKKSFPAVEPRPYQGLLDRAEEVKREEAERQAQEARRKHIAEMQALAKQEPKIWKQVDDLLANEQKIASVYDRATSILENLKQLADYQDTRDIFYSRVNALAQKYASRSSLMSRWRRRGWI